MKRLALLAALALSACATSAPAPVSYGANAPPTPNARTVAAPPPAHYTDLSEPAPAPDWAPEGQASLSDYALRPEDVQPVHPGDAPRTHTVANGERLSDIAARYQIPVTAIIEQNAMTPPYALRPGQTIALPPPRLYEVQPGESFAEIAQRFQIQTRSLALLNRMQPPYDVRPGDVIVLPAVASTSPPQEPTPGWRTQTRNEEPSAPASLQPPSAIPTGNGTFAWPVEGEVLARFGRQANGGRLDGVEIAANAGQPMRAAADGEVVYAGADVPGYGALVLVQHEGAYVTAYGYGARALVREGQRVRRGDSVAEAGERGRMLFQVRENGRATDPLPLLGGR